MYSFTMLRDRVEVTDNSLSDTSPLKKFSISYKNLSEVFDRLSEDFGGRTAERSLLLPEGCLSLSIEKDRIILYQVFVDRRVRISHQDHVNPLQSYTVPFPRTYIKSQFSKHNSKFKFSKMWVLMSQDLRGSMLTRMPFPNIYSNAHEVCMGSVGRNVEVSPTDLREANRVFSLYAESTFNNDLWSMLLLKDPATQTSLEFTEPRAWFEYLSRQEQFPYSLFNFSIKGWHIK